MGKKILSVAQCNHTNPFRDAIETSLLTQTKCVRINIKYINFFCICVPQKKNSVKLSQQQEKVAEGAVPMPIYTAINSRRDISAQSFAGELFFWHEIQHLSTFVVVTFINSLRFCTSEWVEFTPYEIGMDNYGTFMKTELFGSKFFCGKLVEKFPESPLYYLQGLSFPFRNFNLNASVAAAISVAIAQCLLLRRDSLYNDCLTTVERETSLFPAFMSAIMKRQQYRKMSVIFYSFLGKNPIQFQFLFLPVYCM